MAYLHIKPSSNVFFFFFNIVICVTMRHMSASIIAWVGFFMFRILVLAILLIVSAAKIKLLCMLLQELVSRPL